MKNKLLASLISILALSTSLVPGANIAWVSFHTADGTPSTAAASAGFTNAPDKGYTALLAANGHNVTRFLSVDLDVFAFPDLIAAFNTNDLVIVSRSVGSGQYELANETAAWNGLTVPLMSLNGYINRANRLGFNTGNTIPDISSNPVRLRVIYKGHPIFAGLAMDSSNLMVNPFAQFAVYTNATSGAVTTQRGISVVTSPRIAGGTVLASVGTPGDVALGGMMIGEFPAGITSQRGDLLAAKRFVFLTGGREQAGSSGETAGVFDLHPDGRQLFLNAVTYLTTTPPPLAPECTAPLTRTTNVVVGDTFTFDAGVAGDTPRTYQWYKDGQPLLSEINETLVFAGLTAGDAGEYQLFVTNATGWATSTLGRVEFKVYPPTSITNSLISYWPLDGILGTKTVDLVSSYDMSLNNLTAANLVAGKWGNAFEFYGTNNTFLSRINNTGDSLPIYQHPDFSVSLWVNGLPQTDRRVFSEGSTVNGNPLLNLGTHNTAADGTVDIYIRNDAGATAGDHRHSVATAFDGTWHNIVYVQRDAGGGDLKAQLWVDGVLDSVVITPVLPLTANTTTIGGILRAASSALYAGLIDEVALWNRALSAEEVAILQVTAITNPPSRVQPLTISSFKADLPAVISGGATTLRWDVSKDASQVIVSQLGDVTAQTVAGIGSRSITQSVSTTYVLTVNRGVSDTLSATTSVAVVSGVASGWTLLDNFDQSALGNLFDSGYWNDTSGNAGQVVLLNGNRSLRTTSAGISFLNLRNLSIQETQTCTLFFRVIAGEDNAGNVLNVLGLTDKSQRGFGDSDDNIGSVVYVSPFTNDLVGITTNGWYLGARNFPGGVIDYLGTQPQPQEALEAGAVYNVWVDITNAPLADLASDIFSVYVQKEGGAPRTVLFQDFTSDRDLFLVDPVLGGIAPVLDKLIVMGNSATFSALYDDFYLSRGAYNATIPKPYGVSQPPLGPLSVAWVGNQLQISWSNGTLQSSANVNGPYVDVPGNPTSPLLVTPTGQGTFYRSRQ